MHEQGLMDAIDRALQKAPPITGKVHETHHRAAVQP
jgi:hypothetical protein